MAVSAFTGKVQIYCSFYSLLAHNVP